MLAKASTRGLRRGIASFAGAAIITCSAVLAGNSGVPYSFCAAYYHPGSKGPVLTLFPLSGPSVDVPLPAGLPKELANSPFSPTGKGLLMGRLDYGPRERPPNPVASLFNVEFKPARQTVIPGSVGLGLDWIWRFAYSQPPGRIFVSGAGRPYVCGVFVIDTIAGAWHPLVTGNDPECGGGIGPVSPDGKRIFGYSAGQMGLLDIETGSSRAIPGIAAQIGEGDGLDAAERSSAWSPDGRWVAVPTNGRIILIDANNPSSQKTLKSSWDGPMIWSPDARYLLIPKSQAICSVHMSLQSLEVLDVTTGKSRLVPSSRCKIGAGPIGWMDSSATE